MKYTQLEIYGSYVCSDTTFKDVRGAFAESWESDGLEKQGIVFRPSNSCLSYNEQRGTFRGLHYQAEPFGQAKIVTCAAGKIFDIIVDIRSESPTYLKWQGIELSAFDGHSIYIPKGCAHGFITLQDYSVVSYLIDGDYSAQAARAIRWNDPAFAIVLPIPISVISRKDSEVEDFKA